MGRQLSRKFFDRSASDVAPDLLGLHLVRTLADRRCVGRIVEVEAYEGPHDLAAHSASGRRTPRNEVMYGPPGRAYVYMIYGIHQCFNVVTAGTDEPHAVLVRAVEPVENLLEDTKGPGLLCRALEIDRTFNHHDLTKPPLRLERPPELAFRPPRVVTSTRIGLGRAGTWVNKRWRFCDASSDYLSRKP